MTQIATKQCRFGLLQEYIHGVSGGQMKQAITKYYVEPSNILFKIFILNSGSYPNILY